MIQINDDDVLFRVIRLHFIAAYYQHEEIQSIENFLNLHFVRYLIDSDDQYRPVVFAISVGVNKTLFQILNRGLFQLGY